MEGPKQPKGKTSQPAAKRKNKLAMERRTSCEGRTQTDIDTLSSCLCPVSSSYVPAIPPTASTFERSSAFAGATASFDMGRDLVESRERTVAMLGRRALVQRMLELPVECTRANQASKGPGERRGHVAISAARRRSRPPARVPTKNENRSAAPRHTIAKGSTRPRTSSGRQLPLASLANSLEAPAPVAARSRLESASIAVDVRASAVEEPGQTRGIPVVEKAEGRCGGPRKQRYQPGWIGRVEQAVLALST